MHELIAWDKQNDKAIEPERSPNNNEWARFPSGTKKTWFTPKPKTQLSELTTNNEQVTINGNPTVGLQSVYFGKKGDTATMIFDIVDDQGVLQTQLDSVNLGYPPTLMLPIVKVVNGDNTKIVNEVYFSTTLIDGVITVSGGLNGFPESGNWKLLTDRVNDSLSEISADWIITKSDITFRISS